MEAQPEQLRRFLLGQLPEAERDVLEERLFGEPGFEDAIEEAERDLLDAFARRTLSPDERFAVEDRLLFSEAQLDKLRFAEALAAYSARAGSTGARSQRLGLPAWMQIAAMLLVALGGIATAAYYFTANRELKRQIAASAMRPTTGSERPPFPQPPSATLSNNLLVQGPFHFRDIERGRGQEPSLAVGSDGLVRLNFEVKENAEARYNVSLKRGETEIFSVRGLRADHQAGETFVSVWLPASILPPGNYHVEILPGDPPTQYAFRITLK